MILVLTDLWPPFPGGAERLMFNLARDLHRRGEHVHVLTGYENAQAFDGPTVSVLPIGVFDTQPEGWAMLRGFIEATHPDLVLTSHLYASQFGAELVATGLPVVHVVLNGPRVPGCAAAVYITEWVKARYEGRPQDMVVLPPAFADIAADTHGAAIGFVKPIPHKGVETLYDIAERLPHREFVVLRGEWQDIEVIRTDLPNVRFVEPVVHMSEFYRQVQLVLMPSRSEDAGTVAQEATVNGLPCISSDVDGLAETNGGGIRLAPTDTDAWVDTIERLLADPTLYEHVVASQRQHLEVASAGQLDRFAAMIAELRRT